MRHGNLIAINRVAMVMRLELWVSIMADELMPIEVVVYPFSLLTSPTLSAFKQTPIEFHRFLYAVNRNRNMKRWNFSHFFRRMFYK